MSFGGNSLVPRPSFTAFFRSRGKKRCHGCEKSCEGRPGCEARGEIYYYVIVFSLFRELNILTLLEGGTEHV